MKKCARKGCRVFAIHITKTNDKETKPSLEDIPLLNEFKDVFPGEISGLPPKRHIEFTIELVPGAVPASKGPYRMNTTHLVELKLQLQKLIDKEYIKRLCLHGEHPCCLLKRRMAH